MKNFAPANGRWYRHFRGAFPSLHFMSNVVVMARIVMRLDPIGWYVRVITTEVHDGVYNTLLYIAGFATPAEAEQAVRQARRTPTDSYEVLPDEITPDRGPQPKRGEVRLLNGAV